MKIKTSNPECDLCSLSETCVSVCLDGKGNKKQDIMIVKESPTIYEDCEGVTVMEDCDGNEKGLSDYLSDALIYSEDYYITHAVVCRPPGNRTPKPSETKTCGRWLRRKIKRVKPKYVLLMGNTAVRASQIFEEIDEDGKRIKWKGIANRRGKYIEKDGIFYLPTHSLQDAGKSEKIGHTLIGDMARFALLIECGGIPKEKGLNYSIIQNKTQGRRLVEKIRNSLQCSFDIETTGLYPFDEDSRIISMGWGFKDEQIILPLNHPEAGFDDHDNWVQDLLEEIDEAMKEVHIIAQGGKFDLLWVREKYGSIWKLYFDTMLAHYLLDENQRHGLDYLSRIYCGAFEYDIPLTEKFGNGPLERHCEYLALDVFYTYKLKKIFYSMLRKEGDVKRVFDKILMPCANLFIGIEHRGFFINIKQFGEAEVYLRSNIDECLTNIAKIYPHKKDSINWGAPKQVAEVLFGSKKDGNMGLSIISRTPKGGIQCNESVLKRVDNPLTREVLALRGHNTRLSFFIEGWKPFMRNQRIHPSFKLHGTVTGRPSCEHPNLQQTPRDPRIRTLICAPKGYELLEWDLSQIEMRIAAEVSGDHNLMETFLTDIDVHWKTAMREIERGYAYSTEVVRTAKLETGKKMEYSDAIEVLVHMGPDRAIELYQGWKAVRKKAKAVNFGYLYGMWWKRFKEYAFDKFDIDITDKGAEQSREAFFELYPGLLEWHSRQRLYARRHGFVKSLTGRKRRLPAATWGDNSFECKEAGRQAINSPVQSFASDWNLCVALQVTEEFKPPNLYIVGTVHDAVLAEVKKKWVKRVGKRVQEIMEYPRIMEEFKIKLRVPICGDVEVGPWAGSISYDKWVKQN